MLVEEEEEARRMEADGGELLGWLGFFQSA